MARTHRPLPGTHTALPRPHTALPGAQPLRLGLTLGLALTLGLLGLSCRFCRCRFLQVASVPSPPGTSRTQVVSPLAQSATAMHISTRLLF